MLTTQRAGASSYSSRGQRFARSGRHEGTAMSGPRALRGAAAATAGHAHGARATVRLCPGHAAPQTPAGLRAPMSEIPERTRKPQKSGHPRPRPFHRNGRRVRAAVRLCLGHGGPQTPAGLGEPSGRRTERTRKARECRQIPPNRAGLAVCFRFNLQPSAGAPRRFMRPSDSARGRCGHRFPRSHGPANGNVKRQRLMLPYRRADPSDASSRG
jgi:hypothetical protein